jgi:chromate transport protein ChrA
MIAVGFVKEDYLEGLALAQLAPGPLAAQLAIYLITASGRNHRNE